MTSKPNLDLQLQQLPSPDLAPEAAERQRARAHAELADLAESGRAQAFPLPVHAAALPGTSRSASMSDGLASAGLSVFLLGVGVVYLIWTVHQTVMLFP